MSKKFLVSLDLNKNELLNARLQNLSSDPSSPVAGQIYYNTQENVTKFYDGTQWVSGGSTKFGLFADRPAASKAGTLFVATDTYTLYLDNGTAWIKVSVSPQDLTDAITNANLTIDGTEDQINVSKVDNTVTISLPSYINVPDGELDIKKTEYWRSGTQQGVIAAQSDGSLRITGTNNGVQVEANSGNVDISSNNADVNINADGTIYLNQSTQVSGRLDAQGDARISNELTVGGWNSDSGYIYIKDNGNNDKITLNSDSSWTGGPSLNLFDDTRLKFIDNNNEIYTANLWIDQNNPGQLNINATGEIVLSTDGSQASGNIILNPDGHVQVQGNLNATNRLFAGNGIYVGGSDIENDGFLRVQDLNGNNVFTVDADGAQTNSELSVTGHQKFYTAYSDSHNLYGTIDYDGDQNLVINANQNNLILQSDNSNSVYVGSVSGDHKVATIGDLNSVQSGLSWKQAVNVLYDDLNPVLTGNSITSPLSIDDHPFGAEQEGYRVLIINGDNAGIYVYTHNTTWSLNRATDADTFAELKGAAVFVMEGATYGSTSWIQSSHYLTDFTGQDWHQFSGQGTYKAGNGLDLNGTEFSVSVDNDTISINNNNLKVNYYSQSGLETDGGLYVKLGEGLVFDGSGNITNNTSAGYGVRKFATTIGNNSATSFNLDHNFDTRHVTVQVFEAASPYSQVEVDVERTSTNRVTIRFASAPGTGEFEVVIVG